MTDGDLLQRYAASRDSEAFTELVRRHGGMVHAAARRLAGDGDADDVAQAVFLLLAQRAGKLARHRNVAGWLYNVTRYCASNARRTRGRRGKHLERYQQQEAAVKRDAAAAPSGANDPAVAALLDAGLAKLKDDQRQAVLLRYIEGLSLDEAADRLGINAPAVAKRAERGIARLREYFQARGVALSDAALAATPLPAALLASLSEVGAGGAATGGAAIAATTAKSMTLATGAKAAAVVLLIAGGAAVTFGVARTLKSASPRPAQAAATTATTVPAAALVPAKPTAWYTFDATGERYTMRVITGSAPDGDRHAPRPIMTVTFFDADENQREWNVTRDGSNVIEYESVSDPIGGKGRVVHEKPRAKTRAPTDDDDDVRRYDAVRVMRTSV